MSPFCHETFSDQSGGVCDEETDDQWGVPERLGGVNRGMERCGKDGVRVRD